MKSTLTWTFAISLVALSSAVALTVAGCAGFDDAEPATPIGVSEGALDGNIGEALDLSGVADIDGFYTSNHTEVTLTMEHALDDDVVMAILQVDANPGDLASNIWTTAQVTACHGNPALWQTDETTSTVDLRVSPASLNPDGSESVEVNFTALVPAHTVQLEGLSGETRSVDETEISGSFTLRIR